MLDATTQRAIENHWTENDDRERRVMVMRIQIYDVSFWEYVTRPACCVGLRRGNKDPEVTQRCFCWGESLDRLKSSDGSDCFLQRENGQNVKNDAGTDD